MYYYRVITVFLCVAAEGQCDDQSHFVFDLSVCQLLIVKNKKMSVMEVCQAKRKRFGFTLF